MGVVPLIGEKHIKQIWNTNEKGIPISHNLFDLLTYRVGGAFKLIQTEGCYGSRKILIRTEELRENDFSRKNLIGEYDISVELLKLVRDQFTFEDQRSGVCDCIVFQNLPKFTEAS